MKQQLIAGQQVTVNSFCGKIVRIVVQDLGDVVLVTKKETYESAKRAGNQPVSIGFRRSDVLSAKGP
jgi:hypothetical protein